jgi:hydrophobe/amphiphile efflux-1 (HAE1) family protein
MWITKVSIKNPVFATMVMAGLCILGIFSYSRLGVEQLPDISFPTLTVQVFDPGASPEAVENDLTKPIENAVNTVSGIKLIRSNSYEGNAEVYVEFRLGTDINRSIQDVRDRIAQIRPNFPREAKDPLIIRGDTENDQPVAQLSVTATSRDLRALTTLTEQIILKELQKASGVGRIVYAGGRARQVLIHIRPEALAAYGVGVDQVIDAIRNSNQNISAGRISDAKTEALVRVEGKIREIGDFNRIIVARRGASQNAPVYLNQVANVEDGEEEPVTVARLNGQPSISIAIYKVQDANIVTTGDAIKEAVTRLKSRLPPGVDVRILDANSDWVQDSLTGVKDTLLEGGLLTILIVFAFLRSWRSTVITGLTLPIAVLSSFIVLYLFGFTLNFMTMMALSLCIGLLIDDAIVVRENIVRHLRMGKDHRTAALDGTQEIGLAVMATTFAIVAVFVPVAFMQGAIGKFFFSFGITVTVAVLVSLFVSFTLDPMLSSVWFDPPSSRLLRFTPLRWFLDKVEAGLDWLHEAYGRVLGWALENRLKTLGAAATLFVAGLFLIPLVGTEFVPQDDEGWISVGLTTPAGASLQYADQRTQQVEHELKSIPEIDAVDVDVFGQGRGQVRLLLKLTDRRVRSRSQQELEKVIRAKLASIPGIQASIGFNTPIFLSIIGPEDTTINQIATSLAADVSKVKGVVDLQTSLKPGTPAIAVRPNLDAMSDLGLTTAALGNVLSSLVGGETVSYWLGPDSQNYAVRVQLPASDRAGAADLGDLMISTSRQQSDGSPRVVPLRQVASIVTEESPQILKRQNLQRRVSIYANVEGRPAGDVGADIQKLISARTLPLGYQIVVGGAQEEQDESGQAALGALGLAIIFIYLILASQFASFLQPVAIMASLPFSLIGVLLALFLTHTTLNIFSIIGFIMLMGLVTKNAILLVDFANQGQREGMGQRQALLAAGQVRLRPILMTTTAMVFGMLPLALGLGAGSEEESPMGRAIIGGVLTSTLLTLVVVPVIYSYLDRWGKAASVYFGRKNAARLHGARVETRGADLPSGRGGSAPAGQPAAPLGDESRY